MRILWTVGNETIGRRPFWRIVVGGDRQEANVALLSHRPTRAKSKATSIGSLSSVSDTTPVPLESAANPGEVRVWTSAYEPGLPILKCSAGITFLAGPSGVLLPLSSLIRDKT